MSTWEIFLLGIGIGWVIHIMLAIWNNEAKSRDREDTTYRGGGYGCSPIGKVGETPPRPTPPPPAPTRRVIIEPKPPKREV